MKLIEGLNFINDINEKVYNNAQMENNPYQARYYETLHSSMVEFIKNFTEKEYNEISLMLRKSVERLEEDLLLRCGKEYKEEYSQYLKGNSKFRIEGDKTPIIKSRNKKQIGFYLEEGTSV